jgi:hypothetical protein
VLGVGFPSPFAAQLAESLRAGFLSGAAGESLRLHAGRRANPFGLISPGHYALMELGEFVPSWVVEEVVYGLDFTDALRTEPIATADGITITVAILDELLALRTVARGPAISLATLRGFERRQAAASKAARSQIIS